MPQKYCYFNGSIIPIEEAKVSAFDIGLLRGFGVYEALAGFGGKIFRYADHWNRFVDSAHTLSLNIPITEDKAEKTIKELLEKNGHMGRANIKFILTGGPATSSLEFNFETPTFYIFAEECSKIPQETYDNGGRLITYNYKREMPKIKTINYITAVNLQTWRKEEKAIEVLYTYDGEIYECAASNVFLVKDGVLITPDEDVLFGITRKVTLEVAQEAGLQIEERRVFESEIQTADEMFITSSFKDIVPIVEVDDFKIGEGKPGVITKDLAERFAKLT